MGLNTKLIISCIGISIVSLGMFVYSLFPKTMLGSRTVTQPWGRDTTGIYYSGGSTELASSTDAYPDLATGVGDLYVADNFESNGNASTWGDWQFGGLDGGNILLYADNGLTRAGIGTSTPASLFQVSAPAGNATTTLRLGDDGASNSVGTCIEITDDTGAIQHIWWDGGTLTTSSGACTT